MKLTLILLDWFLPRIRWFGYINTCLSMCVLNLKRKVLKVKQIGRWAARKLKYLLHIWRPRSTLSNQSFRGRFYTILKNFHQKCYLLKWKVNIEKNNTKNLMNEGTQLFKLITYFDMKKYYVTFILNHILRMFIMQMISFLERW